jgi:LuxR family transcriptional regulator, maltose regulon positive regulatory protein
VVLDSDPPSHSPPVSSPPDPVLLRTKLRPPPTQAGLVSRPRLDALLEAGARARLCLIDASAGSGKTTLLVQWFLADHGSRRVAWVSLDDGDNDLIRFWEYLIEACRAVEPGLGEAVLGPLQGLRSAEVLTQVVLPQLLNELAAAGHELVLVLDDHHLISNPSCHQTLAFFVDHLPANAHVMVATRVDPPLPLARLRASGELVEIRIAELGFSNAEAVALLNDAMGLGLAPQDVQRLWEKTEGWAAGLYLAGLSLRGRDDPGPFIASFEAGHRHILDYLGTEVLARQPEPLRSFLLRTSILQRLSGSLCDAVLETNNSAELLAELEHGNLFLVALDDHHEWWRYHHLFAQLLRLELVSHEPALVPVLHSRAAAWHRDAGDVEAAIYHATAAGNFAEAGSVIARHWLSYYRRGQVATLERWLRGLPEDVMTADPPMALIAAWVGGQRNGSMQEIERWLAAAEAGDYQGPLPAGMPSLPFTVAMVRGINIFDDVGRSLRAARQALDAAGPSASESYWMGAATLGRSLYLSGQATEARAVLEEIAGNPPADDQMPFVVVNTFALLSLLAGEDGDDERAVALARQAMDVVEAQGVRYDPLSGVAYVALAQTSARRGRLTEAEQLLEQALDILGSGSFLLQYTQAMIELAGVRHALGNTEGGRAAVERARQLVTKFVDPGMLPTLLDRSDHAMRRAPRGRPPPAAALTDRELAVLRLLATQLSQQELASELYVSVNTVRTHIQGIYRKLRVTSREEAIAHARELGLLPRYASRSDAAGDAHPGT